MGEAQICKFLCCVFSNVVIEIGFFVTFYLKMRFMNIALCGGFCEPNKDLNQVCTIHANGCFGFDRKLHDLKILHKPKTLSSVVTKQDNMVGSHTLYINVIINIWIVGITNNHIILAVSMSLGI